MPELVLEPLIYPQPIAIWPLAYGWWLLLIGLLLVLGYWLLRRRQRKAPTVTSSPLSSAREEALQQLKILTRPYDQQPAMEWLQQLNQLLKRLCVADYPAISVQTLTGKEWLAFLDSRCTAAGLTRWMVLVDGVYRPNCVISNKAIAELNQAVAIWIERHV